MHIHIHHHHHYDNNDVISILKLLEKKIMDQLAALEAAVAAEDTVIESAVTLIKGIPALIAAAGTDPVRLKALQDDVTARAQALANAIVVGTSAASTTAPVTDPAPSIPPTT